MLKVKLIIDLGNSETRCTLRVGELHDRSRKEYDFTLSNRFSLALDGIPTSEEYNDSNTTIFKTNSVKMGTAPAIAGVYVNGLMCDREFEGLQMKPTAVTAKYNSEVTPLSVFTAIVRAGMWMRDYFVNSQGREITLESLLSQVDWELDILLPPSQVDKGVEELARTLVNEFSIDYKMPKANGLIKISKVQVFSEGVMAYMAVLINKTTKQVRMNKRFMLKSNVLVIDIGAGTTDIVLIRNNVPVESSKFTIKYGGNNIKSRLRQKVNKENDLSLPDSYYEEAVITGKIKQGLREYDVRSQLDISKREVATLINNAIQEFLEAADLPIQTVEYILVVGGGSITVTDEGINPISKYILEGLRRYSPNMGLVDIGDITDQTEGADESDKMGTRELNVVGAGINLDLKEYKEYQESQKLRQS